MRYELGLMDIYPIEVNGTILENEPMFKMTMKHEVDPVRLEDSLYRAIKFHPLFGTQIRFDKKYYLETNNRPIIIVESDEKNRPLEFCKNTNGYPWQVCYSGNDIIFEWCHGVTDGMGAFGFVKTFISIYCGVEFSSVPKNMALEPGLEPFVDKKEKGKDFETDPVGFSLHKVSMKHSGYKTDCHIIEGKGEQLVNASKKNETSPACLLAILLSKAIKKTLFAPDTKKNVAINVVMNLRGPLGHDTMHNCVEYKRMTYLDEYDKLKLDEVGRIYKGKLDVARRKENVVRMITDRISQFKLLFSSTKKGFHKFLLKLVGPIVKDSECNGVVTYIGKFEPEEIVKKELVDIQFRVWHDFGACTIAAIQYNDKFNINLSENFEKKGVAENFIEYCHQEGIEFTNTDNFIYEQIKLVEEDY